MPLDSVVDDVINHAVDLERYKNGVVRRILELLRKVDADIVRQVETSQLTEFGMDRLRLLESQIADIMRAARPNMQSTIENELRDLVDAEIDFHEQTAASAMTAAGGANLARLTVDDVFGAAVSQPFRGRNLGEWFESFDEHKQRRILDEIRIGYVEGESLDMIVRRLNGTAGGRFDDGILADVSRRNLETIVRTAVQHFSNYTQREVYVRLEVPLYLWVSVLDSRTSPICRARSNKVYEVGKGPFPPAHPRCRSTTTPLRNRNEIPDIPSYGEWLREQPRNRVEEILGTRKARLFLDGELTLDRFVNRAGDELTLAELKKRHPSRWRQAGLEDAA